MAKQGGWKQWSEEKARGELVAWRKSGEPLAVFARRRGYNEQRLRWWRGRLGDVDDKPVLAPVRIVERETSSIEILVRSGYVIRVRAGFSAEALVDVVRALDAAC